MNKTVVFFFQSYTHKKSLQIQRNKTKQTKQNKNPEHVNSKQKEHQI